MGEKAGKDYRVYRNGMFVHACAAVFMCVDFQFKKKRT